MIKVKEFYIEESKFNKKLMVLIAVDKNGNKWVCSGDHYHPTYLTEYENSIDTRVEEKHSK